MNDSTTTYQAFLLRLRRADNAGHPVWRIDVARPGEPDYIQFENLAGLCAYLTARMQLNGAKGGTSEKKSDQASED